MKGKKPKISIICCISKNRGIGKNNKLLFNIPADLQHFKKITIGHPIIMGYNTYKSIGRPLPKRLNIVLAKDEIEIPGCAVCHNIHEAIKIANTDDKNEIFFIGGGSVYEQAIKLADKLYLTMVDEEPEADTFFPDYTMFDKIISESKTLVENHHNINFKYIELEKNVKK